MPENVEMLKCVFVQNDLSLECDVGVSGTQRMKPVIDVMIVFSKLWDETVKKHQHSVENLSYFEMHQMLQCFPDAFVLFSASSFLNSVEYVPSLIIYLVLPTL
jgi:hypothetical protein